jgi:ATP-dependent Clp protease adaptor protein ClpS
MDMIVKNTLVDFWSARQMNTDAIASSNDNPPDNDPPDNNQTGDDDDSNIGLATKPRPKTKKPAMYKVIMLNDDYTPMEFVVLVLREFFRKTQDEATNIMLNVHQRGVGICGVYTYEVAETKAMQTMALARKHQHPLQLQLEKE